MTRIRCLVLAALLALSVAPAAVAGDATNRTLATVGTQVIDVRLYHHWQRIDRHMDPHATPRQIRRSAMTFLITADWVLAEAQDRGISLTDRQVTRSFLRSRHEAFSTRRAFRRFLSQTGQTISDVKFRVRLDMLSARVRATDVPTKWQPQTFCKAAYRVPECGGTLPAP